MRAILLINKMKGKKITFFLNLGFLIDYKYYLDLLRNEKYISSRKLFYFPVLQEEIFGMRSLKKYSNTYNHVFFKPLILKFSI